MAKMLVARGLLLHVHRSLEFSGCHRSRDFPVLFAKVSVILTQTQEEGRRIGSPVIHQRFATRFASFCSSSSSSSRADSADISQPEGENASINKPLATFDGSILISDASSKVQTNGVLPIGRTKHSSEYEKSVGGGENLKQQVLCLQSGAAMRPHPQKVATGGEDAYMIEGSKWVGVADGVGGWALSGIDSGLYSREFLSHCRTFAKLEDHVPDPKGVIIKSVEKSTAVGSCTAVLAALHEQTLYVANIGDAGFLLVRGGKVVAKSTPMQRAFNFPYQIGSEGDDPSMTETFEVPVAAGDVLVLATDGLFDNIYEREIADVVKAGQEKEVKPEVVAMWLVKLAHSVGMDPEGRSPFSDGANSVGYEYKGGKLDDVTVVVSYVE